MIKVLKMLCIFLILLFVLVAVTQKKTFKHISYSEFIKQSKYYYTEESYYKYFPEQKGFFIEDTKIENKEQLVEQSEYALIVKVSKEANLYGTAIMNNCTITGVLKGNGLQVGDEIKIYDITNKWRISSTSYFDGMTPMKLGDSYFVFIKKATNPTVKNSYVFSSLKYGHFNVDKDTTFHANYYSENQITLEEAMEYDYIVLKSEKEDLVFKKIKDELIATIN